MAGPEQDRDAGTEGAEIAPYNPADLALSQIREAQAMDVEAELEQSAAILPTITLPTLGGRRCTYCGERGHSDIECGSVRGQMGAPHDLFADDAEAA